jgi:hypothetical protein
MIYGACLRFTSARWLSEGFSFRWASAFGNYHFLRLNGGSWFSVLFPCVFFFYFSLGRVNIAVCIHSGKEECTLA